MRSDWLEAFLTFSRSMNFTHAAEMLHISQPALHVKIGKLADSLGQPLYRKVGRNLVLTPAGERVAAHARDQTDRSNAFIEELRTGASHWPVSLCAGAGAYLYLLGPAISEFTEQESYPLNLMTGDQDRTIELVRSGEAHIGVTAIDMAPPGIAATVLTDVAQVLIVPENHRLARRRRIRMTDLQDEALIVPPANRPQRRMIDHHLMHAGVAWKVAVEANGWDLMLKFAGLGIGLAVVNGFCQVPPGLLAKPLEDFPVIRYQILQRKGSDLHRGAAEMKQCLLTHRNTWRRAIKKRASS